MEKNPFVFTIRARLFLGFMMLCLPLLIMIIYLISTSNTVIKMNNKINKYSTITALLDAQILDLRSTLYFWTLTGKEESKADLLQKWDEINKTIKGTREKVRNTDNEELMQLWGSAEPLYALLEKGHLRIINLPWEKNQSVILDEILKVRKISEQLLDIFDGPRSKFTNIREGGMYELIRREINKNTNAVDHEIDKLYKISYGLLFLIILLSIIVPYFTGRSILDPLNKAIDVADKISAGERDIDIKVGSLDETGKLLKALKMMQDAIRQNEEKMQSTEMETRHLFDRMVESSMKFRSQSSKVASGDLRERLQLGENDVMQELGNDLNLMTDSLANMTKRITDVSTNLISMIEKIRSSANEESQSITSEASAIREISSSLEEIEKSAKQTMTKAQALRDAAQSTHEQGKLGAELVKESIEGIRTSTEKMTMIEQTILDLSTHTQQIGEITAVVNALAQQLKMLSLNAAIEASKAGEAGKGFAAVATEVRNLAEQSEKSTDQVQQILEDIRSATEKAVVVTKEGTSSLYAGSKKIEKTGEVIQTLSQMIDEATISSQQIEVAIRQETIGINQIVESMTDINQATTVLASGIKETTAFINELAEIAQHLKSDVNLYKT